MEEDTGYIAVNPAFEPCKSSNAFHLCSLEVTHMKIETMKSTLFYLLIACMSMPALAMMGQTAAPAPASAPAKSESNMTAVAADTVTWLDSKKAKANDAVVFKTTQTIRTSQGTQIKKGTKLVGTIIAVEPYQKDKHAGQLAVQLDYADMGGGQKLAIVARIVSIRPSDEVVNNSAVDTNTGVSALKTGGAASAGDRSSPLATSNLTAGTGSLTQVMDKFNGNDSPGNMTSRNTEIPGLILSTSPTGPVTGLLSEPKNNIMLDQGTHFTLAIVQK
jgi:hypothetical protein